MYIVPPWCWKGGCVLPPRGKDNASFVCGDGPVCAPRASSLGWLSPTALRCRPRLGVHFCSGFRTFPASYPTKSGLGIPSTSRASVRGGVSLASPKTGLLRPSSLANFRYPSPVQKGLPNIHPRPHAPASSHRANCPKRPQLPPFPKRAPTAASKFRVRCCSLSWLMTESSL